MNCAALLCTNSVNYMIMHVLQSKLHGLCSQNLPRDDQIQGNNIDLLLSVTDFQCRGEKQPVCCYPSLPVLGGALGDKFSSYQSPLASHQAHVVPEQMFFKVYIVQVLVPCSVSDTCFNH